MGQGTWEEGGPRFQPGAQHPDQWREDLNPDPRAGQNVGTPLSVEDAPRRTAYDDKNVHNRLDDLPDDVLDNVPLVPRGSRLKQGATYIDLNDPQRREFTALGNETAEPGSRLAEKSEVDFQTWNLLRGVDRPLGRSDREVEPQGYEIAGDMPKSGGDWGKVRPE